MKRTRVLIVLFVVSLACRPTETQTVRQPRQERAPIPSSVSAARRTPVVVVAHDVLPAVVNIQTEATIRRREIDPFFDPFGFFGGNREYHTQSLGSGFVWTSDGIIVTNNHVVEGASSISVNFNDGSKLPAKLIGVDPDSDVAVLRVSAKNLATAAIGTSGDLMIGESVIAVGNPFGLSGSVTTGVVSALGRSVPSKEQGRTFTDFIQTDASINPGNSGGPLLNIEGKVIGINTAVYANAQGIGFAIPVDRARKVVQDILRYGQVRNAWIGAVTSTLTPEEAKRIGAQARSGALVSRVFGGSPASAAGLQQGDVITAVEGHPVDSRESFSTLTATAAPGQSIPLTIVRKGATRNVSVRAAEPPRDLGLRILWDIAGLRIGEGNRGVVIEEVLRNSRSERIGVQSGDMIVGVNGEQVQTTDDVSKALANSAERSSVVLNILHGNVVYGLTYPMGT
ncbi:MAG TPA: trypsin-like peptidase domain-containing protein [Thermoanaerobaculia bacterium]|nr:trypsin-like peptidase domain-containing protein [Thermoanaerobaculia bacterium]